MGGSDMVAFVREKEAPIEDRFCYWVGKDRYLNPRRIARQVSTSNPDYLLQTLVIDERGKRHRYHRRHYGHSSHCKLCLPFRRMEKQRI